MPVQIINTLSNHRKKTAALLLGIFYMQTALPNMLANRQAALIESFAAHNYYAGSANPLIHAEATSVIEKHYKKQPTAAVTNKPQQAHKPAKTAIGGPGQPEMNSFRSINSNNLVDLFTGDFSYNIPLLDVGGYPVNIHYSSGISMDGEASWVGLGWNINPGTINRNMRGLPDDFNGGDSVVRTQSIKTNQTVGVTVSGQPEIKGFPLNPGINLGVFHNNYNGWGTEAGINVEISSGKHSKGEHSSSSVDSAKSKILGKISLGLNNNSQSGLTFSPSLTLSAALGNESRHTNGSATIGSSYNTRSGISGLQLSTEVRKTNIYTKKSGEEERSIGIDRGYGHSSSISFGTPAYLPTITMPLTSMQFAFKAKVGSEAWTFFPNAAIEGYVSQQYIDAADQRKALPAYGYLYFSNANAASLLDFNREKEIPFNYKTTPAIALPQYTYDSYSINGEGITGSFRPYRGDVGYVYDHSVETKSKSDKLTAELGFAGYFHGGVDFDFTSTKTRTQGWTDNNNLLPNIKFQKSDSTFQETYFRNPGEMSSNPSSFYARLGGDSLINVKLDNNNKNIAALSTFTKFSDGKQPSGEVAVTAPLVKTVRDKRSQVITYFKAADAAKIGLDTIIKSYAENSNPVLNCNSAVTTLKRVGGVRKEHHISEIDVLNPDGRRYVYGLPAYNLSQQDVTFAVNGDNAKIYPADVAKGEIAYSGSDNSTGNTNGKNNIYTRDSIPAFTHSYLLTGILSPDYTDIKGDGITEDDLGDAVKFNYTQTYGDLSSAFGWRTPFEANKANYDEGLKTYKRDDKGTYLYGTKEVWYLNSIESKTMIALFKVSANREDIYSVENGNGSINTQKKLRRLDSIELYSRADLVKNGSRAKPIKTVHFEYKTAAGELCKGIAGNSNRGKLTLDKIWFTYNKNNKGKLNPYVFNYHADTSGVPEAKFNPSYNPKLYDRWGSYKDPAANPGGFNNIDYPYAVQDSAKAAEYAQAWHLTDIRLPSGGRTHIMYEADDYGYVQNRRATQMFTIAGFGASPNAAPANKLYDKLSGSNNFRDYDYVFVNTAQPLTGQDIYRKYLQGLEDPDGVIKLYIRIAVRMPYEDDRWSTGTKYELVPAYVQVESYGATGSNRFWLKLKQVDGMSPLCKAVLQFLRLNLPSKAYPSSEIGDNPSFGQLVKTLGSGFGEIKNAVEGFETVQRSKLSCQTTEANKSFIRLGSPDYKKYGGGLRVKKIETFDNWNAMTGQKESVYGQEYNYTTVQNLNGEKNPISSGVASYEPMIGAEENPFRLPVEYNEQVAPLAPTNSAYVETPLGESFFPAPMVGYSKVRVRTINAKAKSANGWTETQFYTTKDFPTRADYTPVDKRQYKPFLSNFLKVDSKQYVTVSQGFRIELNDMNGKVKSEAAYPENDPEHALHYVGHFYKVENEQALQQRLSNSVWAIDSASGHINTTAQIGKEVEVMVDIREQTSSTFSGNVPVNSDVIPGLFGVPFVIPGIFKFPQKEESRFRSVAITKIVQQHGILDSIVVIDKGSVVTTKNLVYDAETGDALITRTNNEFNDPVYNYNYPARWAYTGMGMAYQNIDLLLTNKWVIKGKLMEQGGAASLADKFFESGDELWVKGRPQISTINNLACGIPVFLPAFTVPRFKLWAVDAAKGKEGDAGIYFVDADGKPFSGIIDSLRIIRSGKRNFTTAYAGGITSLTNPVREISAGQYKAVVDAATKVISSSAVTYKDVWKIENSLYQADSCYTKLSTATSYFYPQSSLTMYKYDKGGGNPDDPRANILNAPYFTASLKNYPNCSGTIEVLCRKTRTYRTQSIIKFDLSAIPSTATVTSAKLDLYPKSVTGLWNNVAFGADVNSYLLNKSSAHYVRDDQGSGGADAVARTNASIIRRVQTNWNVGTPYDNVVFYAGSVAVPPAPDNSCDPRLGIDMKAMVQPIITDPSVNNGFAINLKDDNHGDRRDYQFRSLSFCTGLGANTDLQTGYNLQPPADGNTVALTGPSAPPAEPVPDCSSCIRPLLTVTYTYQKDTCVKVCRSNIKDTVNPYRWGLLGNWRTDRAYTYYGVKQESNAAITQTNIRREGVLKDFTPFWDYGNGVIKPTADTVKWVWNSAVSLYNRKGVEIENYDPLGRYNAGLYGYNLTLPVAVAQNSRYRELLYDGFEDYSYKTQTCNMACATPREIDFTKDNPAASIYTAESHTGLSSLLINQSSGVVFAAPVSATDTAAQRLSVQIDSTPVYSTVIIGKGKGIRPVYKCIGTTTSFTGTAGPIDVTYNSSVSLPTCTLIPRYSGTWTGKLQPRYTDTYTFTADASGTVLIKITNPSGVVTTGTNSATIAMQAGALYTITVEFSVFKTNDYIHFSWQSAMQAKEIVPAAFLYPSSIRAADTAGSVTHPVKAWCIKANPVIQQMSLLPKFSPLTNSKLVASVWMKVPNFCDGSIVTAEGQMTFAFDKGATVPVSLAKTGAPIEGWQRYEGIINVPATAAKIFLNLKAGTSPVLADDIRVQPYNSTMKSFVYNPVNLRLMGELDENNYATFYEYDDDGTLVRVKKETERGIQTIKETRSALLKDQ